MQTKLIKIGNSFAVIIPDSLIKDGNLATSVELSPTEDGIFITSKTTIRESWEEQLALASNNGEITDGELLEGFEDEFEKEWEWK